ncbi:uncharacterized protein [Parasteatoda tepidariorum]|uniref:uncharacterized protein n=1 Tax=Parasteatoda tepidariorum TaxID=114398 RepID=UPI001C726EDA|nr:uncharacterized protein LOC107449295 [Parasteatoda tepidariorum]
MEVEIDTELLIRLIEERPCLWDRTLEEYKLKTVTIEAWNEVFRLLNPDFESLPVIEKREFGNVITRRWRNIRDSYLKSQKRPYARKTGTPPTFVKKYIFHDELQFLHKVYSHLENNFTYKENKNADTPESNFKEEYENIRIKQEDNSSGEEYDIPLKYELEYYISEDEIEKTESNEAIPTAEELIPNIMPESTHSVQCTKPVQCTKLVQYIKPIQYIEPVQQGIKRKHEDTETRLISAIEKLENPNPHVSFMNSLLPTLNNLTSEQTLEFQFEVLKLLKNIASSKSVHTSRF